jgi:prepilin-type N-terminal cleavage/methylation domain-containing protein
MNGLCSAHWLDRTLLKDGYNAMDRTQGLGRERKVRKMTSSRNHGFTLVELMMTLAVLGVLLAVAVPLYQDYTTRARVAQLLTNIDSLRTAFHVQDEVEGGIPKFTKVDAGKIPPELSEMPIDEALLRFHPLQLWLIQSSSHYGPFDGKDVPYLTLTADNHGDSRYLTALAHELPHSAYAWIVEPMAMVVPLLDAQARHASHAPDQPTAVKVQPTSVTASAQPQPSSSPSQPLSCAAGQDKVTIPAGMSPTGTAFDVCANACGPDQQRDSSNPLACVAAVQTTTTGTDTGSATDTATQGETRPQQTTTGTGAPTAQQQYDDCVAHVLAGHPHGHAYGLIRQCERRYPH